MELGLCPIASGSRGNATLISAGQTKFLIDAGIPLLLLKERLKSLGVRPDELDGILLTHVHTDHIAGLKTIDKRWDLPIYTHYSNAEYLERFLGSGKNIRELDGSDFFIGAVTVSPFEVSHDVHCYGYNLYSNGSKITYVTDLGAINQKVLDSIRDSDILMIESNHDVDRLLNNSNYSYRLKRRIMSERGHLSNEVGAAAAVIAAECGARHVVLAHLSQENNTPELAYQVTKRALNLRNITEGKDVFIHIAMQYSIGQFVKCG